MKIKSILFSTLCTLMLGAGFTACSDDDDKLIIEPIDYPAYILNEGSWGGNNANISRTFPAYKVSTENDFYQQMNGKLLGDLANALIEEDDNLYVVVNGSKYVARLDAHCKEQARHSFTADEGAPRCIDVEGNYAYITQWGGKVSKLNAQTLEVVATFQGGDNLEGIVEENGKLYVANAYKVDGSGSYIYNKEVLVINASDMTLETTLTVVDNPDKMLEINDKIYLLSKGNYYDVSPTLQVIDPKTNQVKAITNASKITEGNDGLIYCVRSAYDANWQLANTFFTYNPSTGAVSETSFLQDAPESFSTAAIYLLEVDKNTGYIYVGTSDYTTNGTIYQFDKSGKLLRSFDAGGINPSTMIFMY